MTTEEHIKYINYWEIFTKHQGLPIVIYYANLFQQYKSNIKKTLNTLNEIPPCKYSAV